MDWLYKACCKLQCSCVWWCCIKGHIFLLLHGLNTGSMHRFHVHIVSSCHVIEHKYHQMEGDTASCVLLFSYTTQRVSKWLVRLIGLDDRTWGEVPLWGIKGHQTSCPALLSESDTYSHYLQCCLQRPIWIPSLSNLAIILKSVNRRRVLSLAGSSQAFLYYVLSASYLLGSGTEPILQDSNTSEQTR